MGLPTAPFILLFYFYFLMKKYIHTALFSNKVAGSPISLCTLNPSKTTVVEQLEGVVRDWGVELLNISHHWKKSKGEGVKIAVLDSGVADHPNLKGAEVKKKDFTGSAAGVEDKDGHGTHCIGIIAARAEQQGIFGVAPACEIYSAKVLDKEGGNSIEALIQAIQWAVDEKVHVISISMVSGCGDEEVIKAAINKAVDAGIFVVAAVGNKRKPVDAVKFPAKYKEVIAVGAIDECLNIAPYSNQGKGIDLVAPGHQILSTHLYGKFAYMNGTSTAVPFVAGQIALGLAFYFKLTKKKTVGKHYNGLKQLFLTSTIQLGGLNKNPIYGAGIMDLEQLFRAIRDREYINI